MFFTVIYVYLYKAAVYQVPHTKTTLSQLQDIIACLTVYQTNKRDKYKKV